MAFFSATAIKSFVSFLPSMMKSWKFWLKVIAVVVLVGFPIYIWNDYQSLQSEVGTLEQEKQDLNNKLETVNTKLEKEKQQIQSLRQRNNMITQNYLSRVRELQANIENKDEIKSNPDAGAKKIEQSFNNYMQDMTCITGGGQCKEEN